MKNDEQLDLVNENGEVVGQAPRSECHSNPELIHQVVHIWIFNSNGQVLWQQRSLQKKESPGKWDMSCGGHIPAGEKPLDGLIREVKEELGIENIKPHFVERYLQGNDKQTEMIYLYYLIINKKETEFVLQKEEVEQVKWFDINQALSLANSKKVDSTDWIFTQMPRILQYIMKNHVK
jgi:isopentenyl-diphosphate delta-isomerase type 1